MNVALINNATWAWCASGKSSSTNGATTARRALPDFVKIAEAHGLTGMRVTSRGEVPNAIRAAEETEGTVVIDFRVESEDSVYPMGPSRRCLDAMIRPPNNRRFQEMEFDEI